MSEPPRILLEHRLKMLKLPTVLREYEKVARHSAHEGLGPVSSSSRGWSSSSSSTANGDSSSGASRRRSSPP